MNVLAENDGRTYASVAIDAPADFVSPLPGDLFPCMIWDHDGRFTAAQRSEVANRLLQRDADMRSAADRAVKPGTTQSTKSSCGSIRMFPTSLPMRRT